jgi:hypothetical protein
MVEAHHSDEQHTAGRQGDAGLEARRTTIRAYAQKPTLNRDRSSLARRGRRRRARAAASAF